MLQVGFAKQAVGRWKHIIQERKIEGGSLQIYIRSEQISGRKRTRLDFQATTN